MGGPAAMPISATMGADDAASEAPSAFHAAFSGRAQRFHRGDHLFYQGDVPNRIYRLTEGTVIVYRMTLEGRRQIQEFAGPGGIVGLTLAGAQSTSAEALTDIHAEILPRAVYERALQHDPDFRSAVFAEVDRMLIAEREHSFLVGFRCALERVAAFLLFLEARFQSDPDGYVPIPMSRNDIADFLGLTLETVSRMLNKLKHRGVIDLPRPDRFRVMHRGHVSELAGFNQAPARQAQRLAPFAA